MQMVKKADLGLQKNRYGIFFNEKIPQKLDQKWDQKKEVIFHLYNFLIFCGPTWA
jgi:hypothetical protein